MHNTLKLWLDDLEEEVEVLSSEDINEEARVNLVTFGFNEELLNEWGKSSVAEFIEGCSNLYGRKRPSSSMVFYAWLDQEAGQFRICAVSRAHGKLPFKCSLSFVSLYDVVDSIYSLDSGLFTDGNLHVWQKNI